jgi:hypothetical protein
MNDEAKKELDRILAMEPAALTESEKAFLSARQDYLSDQEKTLFGITEPEEATEPLSDKEPTEAKPAKRAKPAKE